MLEVGFLNSFCMIMLFLQLTSLFDRRSQKELEEYHRLLNETLYYLLWLLKPLQVAIKKFRPHLILLSFCLQEKNIVENTYSSNAFVKPWYIYIQILHFLPFPWPSNLTSVLYILWSNKSVSFDAVMFSRFSSRNDLRLNGSSTRRLSSSFQQERLTVKSDSIGLPEKSGVYFVW